MTEDAERDQTPRTGTTSHDPDFPEQYLEFMRTGWRDRPLAVTQAPEAERYAATPRRAVGGLPWRDLGDPYRAGENPG